MLALGSRIILEAPAGRGKSTTMFQLAKDCIENGCIVFLIDLPMWTNSGKDIYEFIAGLPCYRALNIDAQAIVKICNSNKVIFLLNGWNEISENNSDKVRTELLELECTFPAAGIAIATRTHHLTPLLSGVQHIRLLPLNRLQRTEYLRMVAGQAGDILRSMLDNDPVLDQITRTPLFLSKVVDIFSAGRPIPTTKIGVLDAVMSLAEQLPEHRNQLKKPPLSGHSRTYLCALAIQMTFRTSVEISEEEARSIVNSVSINLQTSGQISAIPEPQSIIEELCKRHILERHDYPSIGFRFEHQQFQEFFAASRLKNELLTLARSSDEKAIREFTKKYVNEPVWTEPLQMLAEEIGVQCAKRSDEEVLIEAGVLLVKMALSVDPIFAANLARLCGPTVWQNIGPALSDCLRAWYKSKNVDHRECALAGMMASGSPDFLDIILPLLTSNDHQVRLSTYRELNEFHLSTLGPDWKSVLQGWKEEARIDFVREVTQHRWMAEIVEEFILKDPSMKVRVAGMEWLSWVGSREDVGSVLERMDQQTFDQAIKQMSPEEIPSVVRSRVLNGYKKIYSESTDTLPRLRALLNQAKLGETGIVDGLKTELENLDRTKMKDIGEFVIKPALDIIKKTDPQWVSHWVAERVADGSLWFNHWSAFITAIPEKTMTDWFQKLSSEDLEYQHHTHINELLSVGADKLFAENIFLKLCEFKRLKVSTPDQIQKKEHAIVRQLEDLFRAIPPKIAVSGLSKCFDSKLDNIEFLVVIDVLNSVGRSEPSLHDTLDPDLRQKIRAYLKGAIAFVLNEPDSSGSIKAELASCLGRVGEPEDMAELDRLLQADLKRLKEILKTRIEGRPVTITSQCGHYLKALVQLDPVGAENIILNLISEPIYDCESASVLISLAKEDRSEPPFGGYKHGYANIWEARADQDVNQFNEDRRIKFSFAIRERILSLLRECQSDKVAVPYNVKNLAKSLAALDPKGSANLIFEVLSSLGEHDDWSKITALENLLYGGAILPADPILKLFEVTLQHLRKHGSNDDGERLLRHFLCILPFVDDPSEAIKKIREAVSEFRFPRHAQREVLTAIGHSQCKDAVPLLRELAGSNGECIEDLGEQWVDALATLDTPESKKILMSFVDPEIAMFGANPKFGRANILASRIADIARKDLSVYQRLIQLCGLTLPPGKRLLLSEVFVRLDIEESVVASLNLIDDSSGPSVPHPLKRKLETVFVEQKPYGQSGSTHTLSSQSFNVVREKLFEMFLNDPRRKKSAYALLGQIERWRVEYGKPPNEPRHPSFESGEKWPTEE
ncbi:MAG: hypothetical protein COV45_00040 [Deltaproteobacteria bacterium CG11_big_fil_rev_8_21_14_0_20_47_16]|nr:MAG: hypothetical protein COV45_00040 [Deltaproteobacteria bacterium CG11_big_fil_rev_8_21_14_0_20_47_16]